LSKIVNSSSPRNGFAVVAGGASLAEDGELLRMTNHYNSTTMELRAAAQPSVVQPGARACRNEARSIAG
jgi:hypothetical protein